jgi:hypothetical protein
VPCRTLGRGAGLEQQLRGQAVGRVALDHIERLVDGASYDRVEELERILATEKPKPHECAGGRTKLACFQAGEIGRVAQLDRIPEDRGRAQEGEGPRRQASEAKPDGTRNALGSDLEQTGHVGGGRADSLPGDRVEHSDEEERISTGRRFEGGGEGVVRLQAVQFAGEHGDRGAPKRLGADRGGLRVGDQLCDKCGIAALSLGRPGSHNHEERHSLEPSGQVQERPQRGGIGPVQVVDRKQGRLVKGHVGHEPVETVEDREGALCGRLLRAGELGGPEERLYERGRPREELGAELRRDRREQRLEQLPDDPVGKLALEFAPAGREHSHPRRAGDRARLGEQASLADAGTSLDHDEPPLALPGCVGQCLQARDLSFALQEHAGGSARRKDTCRRHHD